VKRNKRLIKTIRKEITKLKEVEFNGSEKLLKIRLKELKTLMK
jgi:hypothetical protein